MRRTRRIDCRERHIRRSDVIFVCFTVGRETIFVSGGGGLGRGDAGFGQILFGGGGTTLGGVVGAVVLLNRGGSGWNGR